MVDCLKKRTNWGVVMGRYDLTDEQYALIEPHLPTNTGKTGHPYGPHRPILNGILWRLHTGAPWPDIPERYGNWKTIYDRYTTWRRNGTFERAVPRLPPPTREGHRPGGRTPRSAGPTEQDRFKTRGESVRTSSQKLLRGSG